MNGHDTTKAGYPDIGGAARGIAGGVMMGLANLVPGISGGTMLLAAGVYPDFVGGVAEVSTFRFRLRSIVMLACIIGGAIGAIVTLAGPMSELVINHRWIMYSLFIGLTLGGVPLLMPMVRPIDPVVVVLSIAGIALMAVMAVVGPGAAPTETGAGRAYAFSFLAGLAGASAMVLPGISGGYLLLILGQYVVVLTAIATLKDGVRAGDWATAAGTLHVIIPVGLGVVVGVVGVSNVVKILLDRFERGTVAVLLGLLLGAVLGLWPFQAGQPPAVGASFRGDTVVLVDGALHMQRAGRMIEAQDWETAFFTPSPGHVAGAAGLIAGGFGMSILVAHLGRGRKNDARPAR